MFALSFTLFFTLRDWTVNWGIASDAINFINRFQASYDRSLSDIYYQFLLLPHGREPFWQIYLWLSRILIGDHAGIFIFSYYFIIFLLIAYFGKLVDRKRFVVVIACILFVSPGFMNSVFGVWRHTLALLVFFIGIYLFEFNKHKLISRILIYSSALIHLVTLPLVLLYEFFTLCTKNIVQKLRSNQSQQIIKLYSIDVIIFAILIALIFKLITSYGLYLTTILNFTSIYKFATEADNVQIGINNIFNTLSYFIIIYFWFNQKKISKNDIFIGIAYFAFILALIMLNLPSGPIGRVLYVIFVGAGVLVSRLVLTDFRFGFILLLIIICNRFYSFAGPAGVVYLSLLLHGEYLNPAYGLCRMILEYDTFFNFL